MGWLSNLVGSRKRYDKRVDEIVARIAELLTSNDEAEFVPALTGAVRYGPMGSDVGVRAMEEAMRRRAHDRAIQFAAPEMGTITARDGASVADVPGNLVDLARQKALLRDPRVSQDLLSACLSYHGEEAVRATLMQVLEVGGPEQFFSFQLLYNHQMQAVKLADALGGRTWTEQMGDEDRYGTPQWP